MKEPPVKDIFKMDDPEDNITSWTGLLYPASISVFYFYNSYSFIFCAHPLLAPLPWTAFSCFKRYALA